MSQTHRVTGQYIKAMKMTKTLSLLLRVVTTVVATTIRPKEELVVAGALSTMKAAKIAGEETDADVNNHHIISRESWDNGDK